MNTDVDRIRALIERGALSPVALTHILVDFASTDRSGLSHVVDALTTENREAVFDVLSVYPQTEVGWSVLPSKKDLKIDPAYSRKERADLHNRQYREDRESVEHLRWVTRGIAP